MCLLFCGTGDQTQGFVFARRALCHRERVCVSLPMHQTIVILGLQTSVSTEETAHQKSFICSFQSYVLIPLGAHECIYAHTHTRARVTWCSCHFWLEQGWAGRLPHPGRRTGICWEPVISIPTVLGGPSLARVSTLWKLVGELTRLGCKNMSSVPETRKEIKQQFFETFICTRARNIKAHSVILPWACLLSVLGGAWGCIQSD